MNNKRIHNILGLEIECLSWHLSGNDHFCSYSTIEEYYNSDEIEGLNTGDNDDIYQLQIYENTPVGFMMFTSNSIDDMRNDLAEHYGIIQP